MIHRPRIIGRLEKVTLNGEGNIHLFISKESKEHIFPAAKIVQMFEGKDVLITIEEMRRAKRREST